MCSQLHPSVLILQKGCLNECAPFFMCLLMEAISVLILQLRLSKASMYSEMSFFINVALPVLLMLFDSF